MCCVVCTPTIMLGHLSRYTESAGGETPEIVMSPPDLVYQDYIYIKSRNLGCVCVCVCALFLCEGKCLSCSQLILEPGPHTCICGRCALMRWGEAAELLPLVRGYCSAFCNQMLTFGTAPAFRFCWKMLCQIIMVNFSRNVSRR